MNEGWVKIYRKLLDNPIMQEPELLQLFIYLILRANHADKPFFWNSETITVKRGSVITGRFEIAKTLKQNPNTIYKRMQKLEKLGFCNIKTNSKNSLVTLLKYDYYQGGLFNENVNRNNTVTTREQQSNTNKNDKNEKNKKPKTLYSLPNELNNSQNKEAWQRWIEYRAERKKGITLSTAKLQLGKLVEYQAKGMSAIEIINQSIEKGWLGLFPIKQEKPKEQITSSLRLLTKDEPAWL